MTMPKFRIPKACETCDSGELLISYTYDEQLKTCIRTCQTYAQVFSGGLPLVFLVLFAGFTPWFFNWIERNYRPRRVDDNAR